MVSLLIRSPSPRKFVFLQRILSSSAEVRLQKASTRKKESKKSTIAVDCSQWNCIERKQSHRINSTPETILLDKISGKYACSLCKTSGHWTDLLEKTVSLQIPVINDMWTSTKPISECDQAVVNDLKQKCGMEDISNETLAKYRIGMISLQDHLCFALPWLSVDGESVENVLLLRGKMQDGFVENEMALPFGWHAVSKSTETIVVCSHELDVLAVYQSTGLSAVCLSAGQANLPTKNILDGFQKMKKVILWLNSRSFSSHSDALVKLRSHNIYVIGPDVPLSPLAALKDGADLREILAKAECARHDKITNFHQLRPVVYNEINHPDQVAGTAWQRFPILTKILQGHRRGELTVFTGPTGAGKTTFMSEYSLDLCMQGVRTLWGSFEVRNARLAKIMLNQFSGLNLEKNAKRFDYWADKFERLSLLFMSFHGAQTIKDVVNVMSHAVKVHDIHHVVIDNLQFMMSTDLKYDRFHFQDVTIAEFRKFATSRNVHITLVIHPRKENDDVSLGMASIFGSAKATQEADNVLILQVAKSSTGTKQIQVIKNRFNGTLGNVPLRFNPHSLSMCDYTISATRTTQDMSLKSAEAKSEVTSKKTVDVSSPSSNYKVATKSGQNQKRLTAFSKKVAGAGVRVANRATLPSSQGMNPSQLASHKQRTGGTGTGVSMNTSPVPVGYSEDFIWMEQ